ncbi:MULTISPECIES: N-acetylmuramoyl-L-alanine amidase [unclassified Paracoccus (in: a-proteobacteria)]|uniref:N-acetylmuramoyl-L-alanine amidase family protein n=1 Tax=unclassified Paracoccus (in: a-proteobacteria) TaxID=2688777 RepID=UPI001600FD2F|nr:MULTISPECIES: N-acetylmuramoyl-L-alanine amidase [unclassified Paracoccus (in: a-proteobacteria)]MBB1490072.1 N-acetylmuramoyl-L-alanine amidase [Paracoccus sp. MC1854]MBB1496660.1 N-acetylmuramoyl-L-alanine amidase [Paracoccus sp. MC1862]QQO43675.1 N-acetylmuramoyl-L-alanine amidase [Paracoccus sp. MC1862]
MRLARLIAVAALLALAAPVAAETLAAVDLSRTVLGMEGRDRGRPRPIMLTIGLDRAVPHRIALVDTPPRLVIDLQGAAPPEGQPSADPLALRWGPAPQGGARAILTLPGPMKLDSAQMRAVPAPSLALRLLPVAPDAFQPRPDALTVLRGLPQPADTGADRNALTDERLRVVLDPGHGGIDPGAQVGAISEAAVMLGFAQEFAATLRGRGIEVVLTREDDRFIPLERRTTVARAKGADLFISLHADALPAGEAAGASIYAWDGQSNDRAARQLALMHDRSDILAGLDLSDTDEDVSRALMDLARLDTQPRSVDAARHLVAKMNEAGMVMHRVPIRGAAFSVLKSPDIPSLLVELGFLTHPQDRANLFDPAWRQRVAEAMTDGILAWDADQDGQGPAAAASP